MCATHIEDLVAHQLHAADEGFLIIVCGSLVATLWL